ncbi:hypothetical protein CDEST_09075 [Colletotrichum destructivum]|uniref:Uncharacterized protein n=1 Tax=Colletotrichum destructivum TaxID=34406 RepID=A0AAX4ILR6_9PEZI|nr:hypothetical protein CDEST_09075 [Colletotrichum destructivum]
MAEKDALSGDLLRVVRRAPHRLRHGPAAGHGWARASAGYAMLLTNGAISAQEAMLMGLADRFVSRVRTLEEGKRPASRGGVAA